jgi:serine/threonine protein phosphatase PrpC
MSAARDWYAGASEVGLVRPGNEDCWLARPPIFAVADGLGGHDAGEVASRIAVDLLDERASQMTDLRSLDDAMQAANLAVIDAAREGKGRSGMGTTLTAIVVQGTHLLVSHVGDSRAYLLHQGRLEQVTQDHSMVADMVRQGTLTHEESRFHPNRSVITRALGTDPSMLPDSFEVDASRGDRLLLCSDGLHGQVPDPEITEILTRAQTPADAAAALVSAANDAGGVDNVTVVVVEIGGAERAAAASPAAAEMTYRKAGASAGPDRDARWSWLARAAWVVAAIAVVVLAWSSVRSWAFSQAYMRAENGMVVVYSGVPGSFAGVTMSKLETASIVPVSALRPDVAARLAEPGGIQERNLDQALLQLELYRQEAGASYAPSSGQAVPGSTPPTTTP